MLKIKKAKFKESVYDVKVKGNQNFYANGVLVHNCVEVTQPTKPLNHIDDPEAEIGICVLSAVNVMKINHKDGGKDLKNVCTNIVRQLDELIDVQEYFVPAAANFTKKRRSLGVGMTNLAAWLANQGLKYTSSETPNVVDELIEKFQYFLIEASVDLAIEKGPCEKFHLTKYSQGILPIDTYKKKVDLVVTRKPSMDWEGLRARILNHGMRHSTLSAFMPCESSSVIQNSTNGIDPVKELLTFKSSKAGSLPVLVPNFSTNKSKYELHFDITDLTGYINTIAAIQKWTDMSISANLYYNPEHYPKNILPNTVMIKDFLYAYSMGIKTLYYNNTYDGDNQSSGDTGCSGGACSI